MIKFWDPHEIAPTPHRLQSPVNMGPPLWTWGPPFGVCFMPRQHMSIPAFQCKRCRSINAWTINEPHLPYKTGLDVMTLGLYRPGRIRSVESIWWKCSFVNLYIILTASDSSWWYTCTTSEYGLFLRRRIESLTIISRGDNRNWRVARYFPVLFTVQYSYSLKFFVVKNQLRNRSLSNCSLFGSRFARSCSTCMTHPSQKSLSTQRVWHVHAQIHCRNGQIVVAPLEDLFMKRKSKPVPSSGKEWISVLQRKRV